MASEGRAIHIDPSLRPEAAGRGGHRLQQPGHKHEGGVVPNVQIAWELNSAEPLCRICDQQIAPRRSTKDRFLDAKIVPEVTLNRRWHA
ncbi:hypothetical protein AL037_21320, partial [Salipiger aestuarii]